MKVMGYLDRWSVRGGDTIEVKVSTSEPEFRLDIVRFDRFSADPDPSLDRVLEVAEAGTYPGRQQDIPVGSYAVVQGLRDFEFAGGLTIGCWLRIGIERPASEQGIVSRWEPSVGSGFRLVLQPDGQLAFVMATNDRSTSVRSEAPVLSDRWYLVVVRVDPGERRAVMDVRVGNRRWLSGWHSQRAVEVTGNVVGGGAPFLLGAGWLEAGRTAYPIPRGCFDGTIDRPAIWDRALTDEEVTALGDGHTGAAVWESALARWDPVQEMASDRLVDVSGHRFDGRTVNRPMRAVVGANWDGTAVSVLAAPEQYGAVRFHSDDLDDCGWTTDATIQIPRACRSGVYAVRLHAGGEVDYVPFYVRPPVSG